MRNTTITCLEIIPEDSMVLSLRALTITSTAGYDASTVSTRTIDWDFLRLQVLAAGKEQEDDLSLRNYLTNSLLRWRRPGFSQNSISISLCLYIIYIGCRKTPLDRIPIYLGFLDKFIIYLTILKES